MQFVDRLSDRQAADAVRDRIAWKYALALPLDHPGFDASVLSEFRSRLIQGQAEHLLLDTMLTPLREQGLLNARGRQRTDATHVLASIRVLTRLVLVGETLRQALNELAEVAPDWLRALSPPEWFVRYARRIDDYQLPKGKAEREAFARVIGADGLCVLKAVYAPGAPERANTLDAVETLRQVWIQQYYPSKEDDSDTPAIDWRSEADLPPASLHIHSPYDLEARHATKGDLSWVGYKAHLSKSCDDELPHLITNVVTTPASVHYSQVINSIHTSLQTHKLVPAEHLLDAGYIDTELIVESEQIFGVDLIGPISPDRSWQAKAETGFALACFAVDWERQTDFCPQGQTSTSWTTTHTSRGEQVIHAGFSKHSCTSCPTQPACVKTPGKARDLSFHPRWEFDALQQARQRQQSQEWKQQYALRARIEGTTSQGVRRCDLRYARYIGLARTHLQHILVAVTFNLVRLYAWFTQWPRVQFKASKFAALAPIGS